MLLRILKIALATFLCILVVAGLVDFFGVIFGIVKVLAGLRNAKGFDPGVAFFGSLLWGVFFRGPSYAFYGMLPLLFIFLIFEWKKLSNKWSYVTVWVLAGLGASLELAGLPAGAIAGYIYWRFVGRNAGEWRTRVRQKPSRHWYLINRVAAYSVLLFLGYVSIGYVWYGYKMVEVTINEPSRGSPEFVSYREGMRKAYNTYRKKKGRKARRFLDHIKLSIFHKVALRDFPDVASCLQGGHTAQDKVNLAEMDWDKINNKFEAEVCTFRLLKTLGGIENATPWLEAQGFRSSKHFSSKNPYKSRNETLSVHGHYSITKNGPKFPTSGVIRRAFRSIPYGMNVITQWSPDGRELVYVRYSFSTL